MSSADPELSLSVRWSDGRPIGSIPCDETTGVVWTRDRNEVSRAEINTYDIDAGELLPWHHWIDVWEDDDKVWSGPIQDAGTELATGATRIDIRDVAIFQWYTWVPATKRWQRLDLAPIAADLWRAMLDLRNIDAEPVILEALSKERFDFATTAGSRYLHQAMDDLEQRGLWWTVYAGRPILGTPPDTPVAEFDETDFRVGLRRVRSGKRVASEVRAQGQNWAHTEAVDMGGLRLQALLSYDNMRGASNVTAAARQHLRDVGTLRDVLEVPSGASLHPDAPVTTRDLIPGNAFLVHAGEGLSSLMRLKTLEVDWTGGVRDIRVTLDAVTRPVQLDGDLG